MHNLEKPHLDAGTGAVERRRFPRLEVLERIDGQFNALEVPIRLLNLSRGGFMVQAPYQFTIGETHYFSFVGADLNPIVVHARIMHSMRASAGGVVSYVAGLEFLELHTAASEQAVEYLVGVLEH